MSNKLLFQPPAKIIQVPDSKAAVAQVARLFHGHRLLIDAVYANQALTFKPYRPVDKCPELAHLGFYARNLFPGVHADDLPCHKCLAQSGYTHFRTMPSKLGELGARISKNPKPELPSRLVTCQRELGPTTSTVVVDVLDDKTSALLSRVIFAYREGCSGAFGNFQDPTEGSDLVFVPDKDNRSPYWVIPDLGQTPINIRSVGRGSAGHGILSTADFWEYSNWRTYGVTPPGQAGFPVLTPWFGVSSTGTFMDNVAPSVVFDFMRRGLSTSSSTSAPAQRDPFAPPLTIPIELALQPSGFLSTFASTLSLLWIDVLPVATPDGTATSCDPVADPVPTRYFVSAFKPLLFDQGDFVL